MTKSKKLDFRPNDYVVYPAHGVGQIISIEEQEVAGITLELFVISFEKDKMTLRVPTNKATEVGMRSLSSPDVISQAMKTLKGKAKVKRAMWSRRAQEYEQKINSGDLISIAEVVRDLHRTDDQREQSYSERQLYEAALERLTREVAAVGGSDEIEAAKQVDNVLTSRAALFASGDPRSKAKDLSFCSAAKSSSWRSLLCRLRSVRSCERSWSAWSCSAAQPSVPSSASRSSSSS